MKRVFPESELVELPFATRSSTSRTSSRGGLPKIHEHDGGPPQRLRPFHDGRLCVLFTFDTDLERRLEDEGMHPIPPRSASRRCAWRLNIVSYVLSH